MVKSRQIIVSVVLLWPLIGMQNLSHPMLPYIFRIDLREFLFHCCSSTSQNCLKHEFWQKSEILCSPTKFWSLLHMYRANNWLQLPLRPNLGVPLDPSFWLWCSFSWKSGFTASHCMKSWKFCSVSRHEVLSNFNKFQKSSVHTKFAQFALLW